MSQSQLNTAIIERAQGLLKLWHSPKPQLDNLVRKRLLEVLDYATQNSDWWKERLSGFSGDSESVQEILSRLPVTERRDMQKHFQDMQIHASKTDSNQILTLSTSGSTGEPVRVVKHKVFYGANYQGTALFEWVLHRRDPKGKIIFLKYGTEPLDNVVMHPLNLIGGGPTAIRRDPGSLSAREIIELIKGFQPRYTIGTLHLLKIAANHAKINQIEVKGILDTLITHADPVTEEDREIVKEIFGAEISNRYSTEEVGWIAIQCTKSTHLHVVAPNMIVEILDKDLKPCIPGEEGEVFLTQLRNFMMPIIRYRVGDVAIRGEACEETNWPVIENIVGRTRDLLVDKNGDEFVPALGAIKAVKNSEILEFQIFLFLDAIAFVYRAKSGLEPDLELEIAGELQSRLRTEVPVKFFRSDRVGWRSEYKKKTFLKIPELISKFPDGEAILELGQKTSKSEVV